MTEFKSTMGAPLTEAETTRIIDKWYSLINYASIIPGDAEPVDMLNFITDIIGGCWEVRRAIDDGWHEANRRAFPDPPRKARHEPKTLNDLEALGLTREQLAEAIKEFIK